MLPWLRQIDVVDASDQLRTRSRRTVGDEFLRPGRGAVLGCLAQENFGGVRRPDGLQHRFVGLALPRNRLRLELEGTGCGNQRIFDVEGQRGNGRLQSAGLLFVDDDPGPALGPQLHGLGAVPAPVGKAKLPQQLLDLVGVFRFHFGEVEARRLGDPGQRCQLHRELGVRSIGLLQMDGGLLFKPDQ